MAKVALTFRYFFKDCFVKTGKDAKGNIIHDPGPKEKNVVCIKSMTTKRAKKVFGRLGPDTALRNMFQLSDGFAKGKLTSLLVMLRVNTATVSYTHLTLPTIYSV